MTTCYYFAPAVGLQVKMLRWALSYVLCLSVCLFARISQRHDVQFPHLLLNALKSWPFKTTVYTHGSIYHAKPTAVTEWHFHYKTESPHWRSHRPPLKHFPSVTVKNVNYEWPLSTHTTRVWRWTENKHANTYKLKSFHSKVTVLTHTTDWLLEPLKWSIKTSLCSTTYVRWQRGTARIRPPLLQQSIDISCPPGTCSTKLAVEGLLLWAHAGRDKRTERLTEGRTTYRFTYPALHTMREVPVINNTYTTSSWNYEAYNRDLTTNIGTRAFKRNTTQFNSTQWSTQRLSL